MINRELMTGYVEQANVPMPLSILTVRSLRDLGYVVDLTKADPYTAPVYPPLPNSGRRLRRKNKIQVMSDTISEPFKVVTTHPKPGREADFHKDKERFKGRRRKLMELERVGAEPAWLREDEFAPE